MTIEIYDTTLRDGAQGEGITFSLEDQLRIVKQLDDFGIDFIEGGQPGSNPKAAEFFEQAGALQLEHARMVAFGSTRHPKRHVEDDVNIKALLAAGTEYVAVFGKSWDLHVKRVLGVSTAENLQIIYDTIAYLVAQGKKIVYDAEHFFDGYKANSTYTLETLKAAEEAGATTLVLCDTNGGSLPMEVQQVVRDVKSRVARPLGIHTHNDSGLGVATSLMALAEGAVHVQGTINGYGERCGNADLCQILPALKLKMGLQFHAARNLDELRQLSHFVDEVANQVPRDNQPYVGRSAFAHKGGMHVNAVMKTPSSFEHVPPESVGNERRMLISEVSGKSVVLSKAMEFGIDLDRKKPQTAEILERVKALEQQGYQFEGAEASFELIMKRATGGYRKFFELAGFRVIVEKRADGPPVSEATIKVIVEGKEEHTAAEGNGPVDALDHALRKAIEKFYPELKNMHLSDFKVRILNGASGTAARTRVIIESSDEAGLWSTVGVSANIIEASWQALVDSIEYKLLRQGETQRNKPA